MVKKEAYLTLQPYPRNTERFEAHPVLPESLPIDPKVQYIIWERAWGIRRPLVLGSTDDVEALGYESLLPSLTRAKIPDEPPRVRIGSLQCQQPYEASLLNCSALSFGPMGKNFILAINHAAKLGGFFQNTGEAGISPFHFGVNVDIESPDFEINQFFRQLSQGMYPALEEAGDVVWQIGNGYFGCRKEDGTFDPEQFTLKANLPNVKMIEIKLSQGVEPRKDMPVPQVTQGIAKVMGIPWSGLAKLRDQHSAFSTPTELLHFVAELRTLSQGKPIGIKMGLSHRHWFLAICKAMRKTGILLDFITLDGMEAGTAAGSYGALGFTGTSLNDAIVFVHNALVGCQLRPQIKIIASGKVFTERDVVLKLARGADLCATARGMLLAVGCDQQLECYQGTCQKGIATQNPELQQRFDVTENTLRAYHYHEITLQEVMELLSIAGVDHPDRLGPFHVHKRVSLTETQPLDEVYEFIRPGSLLTPFAWQMPRSFRKPWQMADPDEAFDGSLENSQVTGKHTEWK